MSLKFDDKVIAQMKKDFEQTIILVGDVIKFRKFESSNVKDPLYDNERKDVSLIYREVELIAKISLSPNQWKMDDQGMRLEVNAEFIIASKSFEDVSLEPTAGRDRIMYQGIEYEILQMKPGLVGSAIMNYLFVCKKRPGI